MVANQDKLEESIKAINEAEEFLYISMPWWWDDEVGRELFNAVQNVSKRNVEIKVEMRPCKDNDKIEQKLSNININITQICNFHGKAICTEKRLMIITENFFKKDMLENINFSAQTIKKEEIECHKNEFLKRSKDLELQLDGPTVDTKKSDLINESEILDLIKWPKLNALQSKVCRHVLYGNENLLIISPTGSGKTLIGELAIYRAILFNKKRAVWIVPSRALAGEIVQSLKRIQSPNIRPLKCLGGEEINNQSYINSNIWICTTEKFESLLRKNSIKDITYEIDTIVIDEIHLIGEQGRGQVLESILARYKDRINIKRLIGLSATLENGEEFAGWLNARLLKPPESWKPNYLHKEVIRYQSDKNERQILQNIKKDNLLKDLVKDIERSSKKKGPVIIFCGSKSKCINRGLMLAQWKDTQEEYKGYQNSINEIDFLFLKKEKIGLHFSNFIYSKDFLDLFINKQIDYLFATTGLAQGVNLPCNNVIILDTILGLDTPLNINQAEQMLGRAGRIYGSEGWGYLICPSYEFDKWSQQIGIKTSEIKSVLDQHLSDVILAEFYLRNLKNEKDSFEFYKRSLRAYQTGKDNQSIINEVSNAIDFLINNDFLERRKEDELITTEVGEATIQLMVNSNIAVSLIKSCSQISIPPSYRDAEIKILKILSDALPSNTIFKIDEQLEKYISEKLLSIGIIINNQNEAIKNIPLFAMHLALNEPEEIVKITTNNNELKAYITELIQDISPRYLNWLARIGKYTRSPWVAYCSFDISKRLRWYKLRPKPIKGSSKLINFLERLIDPEKASTELPKAWDQAHFNGFSSPIDIPLTTQKLSFNSNSNEITKRLNSLVRPQDISLEYDESIQQIRVINLPSDTKTLFAEVFNSQAPKGSTTYISKGRDFLLSIPFASKESDQYKILLGIETSSDRDLIACEKSIKNQNLKTDSERLYTSLNKEINRLPDIQRIAKRPSFINNLRKRIQGLDIEESDLKEWVLAKRQYFLVLSELITQNCGSIERKCININKIINNLVKLESSLNSEPFSFRSIPSILISGVGTKLERELCKICIASNSGINFGLVKGSDHSAIYSICELNNKWYSFERLLSSQLTPIYPSIIESSRIELISLNSRNLDTKPVDIGWVNGFH